MKEANRESSKGRLVNVQGIANISENSDGILHICSIIEREMNLEDAKRIIEAVLSNFPSPSKRPWLVDIREAKYSLNREAREYFAGTETDALSSATAMLIRSAVGRVLANFYLGLNKPKRPTQLFTDEAAAVSWLKQFLES